MKRILLIFCSLFMTAAVLQAQDDDDRDAIANDPHGAAAAASAAQQSLWSLSSYDLDLKKPQYSNKDGWQAVSVPHYDINIDVQAPKPQQTYNPPKKSSSNNDIWHQNARSRAAQTDRAVAGMKRVQAMREAAAERAREERRRKEAENRRDYEAGYTHHKMATAGFYQAKAAEDAWLHTEGVRRLEEVNSLDRADVPTTPAAPNVKTKSGSQLANMLKQQQEIEVVFVNTPDEGRKSGVALGSTGARIDMFDNARVSNDDEMSWLNELTESSPKFAFSNNNCFEVNEEVLVDGRGVDFDSFNITTMPFSGCVSMISDSVFFLDSEKSQSVVSLPSLGVSQMVVCGKRIFGKKGNQVVEIVGNSITPVCTFDNDMFDIYTDTDTTILVHSNIKWLSVILQLNIEKRTFSELARTEFKVRKMASNGKNVVVLVDDFIMRINNGLQLMYCSLDHINDICMSKDGLVIATERNIMLLNGQANACVFSTSSASKVWSDIEDVYAVNKGNNLVKYSTTK